MKDSDYTDLWIRPGFLIRRLHQIHVAMFLEECFEYNNITPVQFAVLTILYTGAALNQVTLAAQVGIDRNTAADVIRRLERRGLLSQRADENDRRAMIAQITKEGKMFYDQAHPLMVKSQERLLEPLTDEEADQLHFLLQKLILANNDAGRAQFQTHN